MGRYKKLGILSILVGFIIAGLIYTYYGISSKVRKEVMVVNESEIKGHAIKSRDTGYSNTPWPMYQGSLRRDGRSKFKGPARGIIKWVFPVDGLFEASPVIGIDGTVYVGSDNSKFYAISPNGKLLRMFQTRDMNRNSAALTSDGLLLLPSADSCLYALNLEGKLKWVFTTEGRVNSSPAVDTEGNIYFGSHDKNLYALNPDGTLKWKLSLGTISASSPSISEDGIIYIGSYDSHLYAVYKNGKLKWKFKADSGLRATPAIGSDGTIYIGSREGKFYAILPDGHLKWSYKTDNDIRASAAIAEDGSIYIGSWDNYFYAFYPNGKLKWKYKTGGPIEASAVIDADGHIYVGSMGDKIYAFRANGKILWTVNGGIINTAPAIGANRTLYICREHTLLAIGDPLPEIDISTNKNEYLIGEDITFNVLVTNEASQNALVDLKIFVIDPKNQQIQLDSSSFNILPDNSIKKEIRYKLNNKGRYIITGKLINSVNGDEIMKRTKIIIGK